MSTAYLDIEFQVADLFAALLADASTSSGYLISKFIDPMSQDGASRICIQMPEGETIAETSGNYAFTCEVTVKTQWTQSTGTEDEARHRATLIAVRSPLWSKTLDDDLNAIATTIQIDGTDLRHPLATAILDGWLYTTTTIKGNAMVIEITE